MWLHGRDSGIPNSTLAPNDLYECDAPPGGVRKHSYGMLSAEVGFTRVDVGGLCEHVDQIGDASGEGTIERRPDLFGIRDQFAGTTEGPYDLVVTAARL